MSSIYESALLENMVSTTDGDYVNILEWIEQNIHQDQKKRFVIEMRQIKELLGPYIKKKDDNVVLAGIRNILLRYGINIMSRLHDSGTNVTTTLTMSFDPINTTYNDALTKRHIHTEDGKEMSILNYIEQETVSGEFIIDAKKLMEFLGKEFGDRNIFAIRTMLRNIFNRYGIGFTTRLDRQDNRYFHFYRKDVITNDITSDMEENNGSRI